MHAADHLADWLDIHPLRGYPKRRCSCSSTDREVAPPRHRCPDGGVARRIALWGEEVGQRGLTGHSTRRGAATDTSRAGARIAELQQLGGRESTAMPPPVANADALLHHPLRGV